MVQKKAVVIKGDGTGPELVKCMMNVLKACNSSIELIPVEAGSEFWEKNKTNSYITEEVWKLLSESDACFKGPTTTVPDPNAPRSVAVSIRQKFELYANIRPIKTYKTSHVDLDFVCVREATEGLYAGIEFKTSDYYAIAIRKIKRRGSERVPKKAFELCTDLKFKKIFIIAKRNIVKDEDEIFASAVERYKKD